MLKPVHFPEIFEAILISRDIPESEWKDFLEPKYENLHNPLLLPDMELARDRVIEAISNKERITVFSDYDADGIPGAGVLKDFFRRAGYENVSFYIPHRHDEGFGLNEEAVREIAGEGTKLLITVDCGIADLGEIKLAKELGMDVIITDHHEPHPDGLPEADAVVDPKRADSTYPFSELCGAALAYKLVQAILEKNRFGVKEGMEKWSIDLVGIATLSDMVPLVGENRIFAKFGLDVLRKSFRPGLVSLFKKLRMDQKNLTEDDVVFMITPRINAASRMGVPSDAFDLLTTESRAEAEKLADHLEHINNERKGVVAALVKDAKKHIEQRERLNEVIVIGNPEWKPSLLGLVANSLVEEYEKPTFVWGRDGDGALKGSCRSYNGYNLHELMQSASEHFTQFGGHAGAGGFTVTLEQLTVLEDKLSEALGKLNGEEEKINDSISISMNELRNELWDVVNTFAPFGTGNPKPMFSINSEIKEFRKFGKENNHLEVSLGDQGFKAISFFSSPETYNLSIPGIDTKRRTVLGHLEKSYFRNRPELRLRIVDILLS